MIPSRSQPRLISSLVAITDPCAFVNAVSTCVIGLVAGVLVVVGIQFIERRLKVDDPVGAVAVHGLNGLWGLISLGIFADGTYGAGWNGVGVQVYQGIARRGVAGLLYGDPGQFVAQLIGGGIAVVWGFGLSYAFFKALDWAFGIRTSAMDEVYGLDIPEMGVLAYPDFILPQAAPYEPGGLAMSGAQVPRNIWKPVPETAGSGAAGSR